MGSNPPKVSGIDIFKVIGCTVGSNPASTNILDWLILERERETQRVREEEEEEAKGRFDFA